jgi:N-hydroxyarylamine O-acetyltransferase
MLDLDAYLERIGLRGRPALAEIHTAHATSIPFENLDSHRGLSVSLAPEDLERKLVHERRGGYCFEHNLLLAEALRALGAEVDLFLARVRVNAEPGVVRPRGHLVLRVQSEGASWHADVGFGLGTLLEPIPFGPGAEYEQAGWRFRVVRDGPARDGPELVLQTRLGEEWKDVYAFLPEPSPAIDVEVSNWWVCSHPGSPFVSGLILGRHDRDGRRVALNNWSGTPQLIEQTPSGNTASEVAHAELPRLIASHFGLEGFALDADGRVALAADVAHQLE